MNERKEKYMEIGRKFLEQKNGFLRLKKCMEIAVKNMHEIAEIMKQ